MVFPVLKVSFHLVEFLVFWIRQQNVVLESATCVLCVLVWTFTNSCSSFQSKLVKCGSCFCIHIISFWIITIYLRMVRFSPVAQNWFILRVRFATVSNPFVVPVCLYWCYFKMVLAKRTVIGFLLFFLIFLKFSTNQIRN